MKVSNVVLATLSFTVSTYALPAAVEQPAVEARGWDWGFGGGKEEAPFSPPAVQTKAIGGWGGFAGWGKPAPAPTTSAQKNPWAIPTGIWHFPTPSNYSSVPVATTTSKAAVHTSSAASTSTKASTTSHASPTSSSAYQHHSPSSKVPHPHPSESKAPHPHPTPSKEPHHPHKPTHTSSPSATTAAPVTTTASSNTAGPTMTMGAKVNLKRVSSPVDNMLIENLAGVF